MKMLSIVFAMLMSSAYAAEIKVLDVPDYSRSTVTSRFQINRELGRAWAEFEVRDPMMHRDRGPQSQRSDYYRKQVPGLSFDASRGVIMLDTEGQQFECASVVKRGRSIFRYNKITNTGCTFVSKHVTVEEDDGFEIRRSRRLQVFLVTK